MNNIQRVFPGERVDDIGFNGLRLIQKPEEFCYGVDAVILADFAARGSHGSRNKSKKKIIDLGTGTGVIPLMMSYMISGSQITGLELQQDAFERACRNVALNRLEDSIEMMHGDVARLDKQNGLAGLFDIVTANPPYMKGRSGIVNTQEAKRIARHEGSAGLTEFIRAAVFFLKDKGDFYMVHRPDRLVDICSVCRELRLEPKELRFVSPNRDKAPNILLVHCVKYGGQGLKLLDPLYIYNQDGTYTEELKSIYR